MTRDDTAPRKGVSLAKGPIAIIGLIGIVYGLSALLFASHGFALHIPHGAAHGKKWIGLEVNGWTELLFIAAGLALLFSAPLHWGAKSMAMLVGLVMIGAAIIAVIRGNGIFGIFAANHVTEVVWAAAGVLLLILALLPRIGARDGQQPAETTDSQPRAARPVEERRSTGVRRVVVRREPDQTVEPDDRREPDQTVERDDRHARWLEDAEPEDRPPDVGARSTEDNPPR